MKRHTAVYRDAAGRTVGKRAGTTFVRASHDHHFLKRPPAVSLDVQVCDLVFQECIDMRVINLDTGAIYGISVGDFQKHMRRLDRGFGEQYMVLLQHWRTVAPPLGEQTPVSSVRRMPPATGGVPEDQPRLL